MQCELCGKETDKLYLVRIEGTTLRVCESCAKYGKVLSVVKNPKTLEKSKSKEVGSKRFRPAREEPQYVLIDDFGRLIKNKRESLGLKQKEFARMLSIKESLLHNIETSSIEPSVELARKLEKVLSLKLLMELSSTNVPSRSERKNVALTLGDFVKVRKKKK